MQSYRSVGIPPFSRCCKIIGRQLTPWSSAIHSCLSVVHDPTVHASLSSTGPAQNSVLQVRVLILIELEPHSGAHDPQSDQSPNVGMVVET